jgi:hypothetical protein
MDNIMPTDSDVLFGHLENSSKIANIGHDVKLRQVLDQVTLIKNRPNLSEIHPKLDKTPLKYFSEYINKNKHIIQLIQTYHKIFLEDFMGNLFLVQEVIVKLLVWFSRRIISLNCSVNWLI